MIQPFRNFYGTEDNPEGGRNIGAAWQSGIQNGVQVGSIIGLWLNGIISDKYGYRKVSAAGMDLQYGRFRLTKAPKDHVRLARPDDRLHLPPLLRPKYSVREETILSSSQTDHAL